MKLSIEEAAFLTYNLWLIPHSGSGPLSLEDIIKSRPGDPEIALILDYPSNWGVSQTELLGKIHSLSAEGQHDVQCCIESIGELDKDTRGRLNGILKDWIRQRNEPESRKFVADLVGRVGVPVDGF